MSPHFSRVAAPCVSVVASAVFILPLTAAFFHPGIAWTFKVFVAGVLVTSGAHPLAGLLAAALILPFTMTLAALLGQLPAGSEIADAILLAFVSGASLRVLWPADRGRSHLAGPALILMAAVLTSTTIEFRWLQAAVPRQPLLVDLWRHVTTSYWTEPHEFVVVHQAVRWTAWLALAVYAERIVRRVPGWHDRICRLWIIAGAAGAMLAAVHLLYMTLSHPLPMTEALLTIARSERFSVLHPDVNAAGSYFALFLVPAIVVGVRGPAYGMLAAAAPLLLVAFMLAKSRAAIAAVVLVLCGAYILHWLGKSDAPPSRVRSIRIAGVVVVGAAALIAMFFSTTQSHVGPATALRIRMEMTQVGVETAGHYPVFGVGLGDYIRMTRRFIAPDMSLLRGFAPNGENAHNNFLQIIVELGIPAGLIFLWLVVPAATFAFLGRSTRRGPPPELQGMSLGIAAFLVSAFFGHPLLIPQVGMAFFIALGIACGLAPGGARRTTEAVLVPCGVAFYLLSLVWRLG